MSKLEEIKEKYLEAMPCTCIPSYKERGLDDPKCIHCNYGGIILEAIDFAYHSRDEEVAKIRKLIKSPRYISLLENENERFRKEVEELKFRNNAAGGYVSAGLSRIRELERELEYYKNQDLERGDHV